MQINIRDDSVEIEGYVNAVERNSKPLLSRMGKFIERIKAGAFARALKRNDDVHVLLNHDWQRDLGSTKKGNLELAEDNIGLRAKFTTSDKDVMEMAKRGDLVGWSFGFYDRDVKNGVENGMLTREVNDLDLEEVSILDRSKVPAYDGTLIMARSEDSEDRIFVSDSFDGDDVSRETRDDKPDDVSRETKQEIDYSKFKAMIVEMKED
nr:MAG TPA: prohead serine protease [Caudoviricetes sp.]